MKRRALAAASALALASVGSFAANLGPIDLSTGSNTFGNTPIAGTFSDFLTFTLTGASTFNGGVLSIVNGTQDVDFSTIVLTGPGGFTQSWSQVSTDPFEAWSSGATASLAAGLYTLTLTGFNSASIGSYSGNLAVTPVPEPQVYAMLLAGLGIVGLVGMRRRRD